MQVATVAVPVKASSELDHLRSLLLSHDRSTLQDLTARLGEVEITALAKAELERAMADVLAGALKTAEAQNHRALARAIAPLVVAVIQSEIKNSKEVMVEALYPLTGRLVSASVAAAVRDAMAAMNSKLDMLTSGEQVKLKIKSIILRKPVSELALSGTVAAKVARVLLVEQGTGTLVAAWDNDPFTDTAPELVAGLIAAVSEFAANAVSSRQGELRTLELGSHRLHLWHSPRHIMAVECVGAPSRSQEIALESAFMTIVDQSEGGEAITPDMLGNMAAAAEKPAGEDATKPQGNAAKWVVMATAISILGLFAWWAYGVVSSRLLEHRLQSATEQFRLTSPQMAGFPLSIRPDHGDRQIIIEGLVPQSVDIKALHVKLEAIAGPYSVIEQVSRVVQKADIDQADLQIRNRLAELQDHAKQLDEKQTANLNAEIRVRNAENGVIRLQFNNALNQQGNELRNSIADVRAALGQQVREITAKLAALDDAASRLGKDHEHLRLETVSPGARLSRLVDDHGLFFSSGVQFEDETQALVMIGQIAKLVVSGALTVELTGLTDGVGPQQQNRALGLARAETVVTLLVQRGVPPERLIIRNRLDPDVALNAPQGGPPSFGRRVVISLAVKQ